MPTRRLPLSPHLDQLKRQAKELLVEQRAGTLQACQRIREFHPRYAAASDEVVRAGTFILSDSQLTIAHDRHLGLALATQFGHVAIVTLLLELGEDPNRFNPHGAHSHSTPLHQAALAGHGDTVKLSIEHGARPDIKDILWDGTPAEWADHGSHRKSLRIFEHSPRHRREYLNDSSEVTHSAAPPIGPEQSQIERPGSPSMTS